MILYLIYALYHKVACKRLISIEILLFDVLALLKYCWKQVRLTNVIWNDRTFHASVLLVEDPKTLSFFFNILHLFRRPKNWSSCLQTPNIGAISFSKFDYFFMIHFNIILRFFLLNNQADASTIQIYSVIKFYTLRYQSDGPGIDSRVVSLDFSVTYFLPTVPWPWGRLSP